MPAKPTPLASARAKRVVERSGDLHTLGLLAAEMGPQGLSYVQSLVNRRLLSVVEGVAASKAGRAAQAR